MSINPAREVVLARPDSTQTQTSSGILVATETPRQPVKGVVVKVGKGVAPVALKPDDTIVFIQYGANPVEIQGEYYYFVKFADIVGVISL